MASKDYYELLNVSPTASQAEINAAYRQWVRSSGPKHFHTRRKPSQLTQYFSDVEKAYRIISSPVKRKIYDQERAAVSNNKKWKPIHPNEKNSQFPALRGFWHYPVVKSVIAAAVVIFLLKSPVWLIQAPTVIQLGALIFSVMFATFAFTRS
ncbi:MAG: DnaJ domain-containing protein [Cyanobacteria bacterium P01_H01_bin.74]